MKLQKTLLVAIAALAIAVLAPLDARAEVIDPLQDPSGRPTTTYTCRGPRSPVGQYDGFSCPGDKTCNGSDIKRPADCKIECLTYDGAGVLRVTSSANCTGQSGTFNDIEGTQY
jgi:hypothetical protein